MGGSKPPSIKTEQGKLHQTVTPQFEYEMAADFYKRLAAQTNQALTSRYQETGTPAELGAINRRYQTDEAAAYLSSIPQGDKYTQALTGSTADRYAPLRQQAASNLSDAQAAYAQALQKVNEKPEKIDENPNLSWANKTIKEGMNPNA